MRQRKGGRKGEAGEEGRTTEGNRLQSQLVVTRNPGIKEVWLDEAAPTEGRKTPTVAQGQARNRGLERRRAQREAALNMHPRRTQVSSLLLSLK